MIDNEEEKYGPYGRPTREDRALASAWTAYVAVRQALDQEDLGAHVEALDHALAAWTRRAGARRMLSLTRGLAAWAPREPQRGLLKERAAEVQRGQAKVRRAWETLTEWATTELAGQLDAIEAAETAYWQSRTSKRAVASGKSRRVGWRAPLGT